MAAMKDAGGCGMAGKQTRIYKRHYWQTTAPVLFVLAFLSGTSALAQEPFRIGLIAQPGEEAQIEGLGKIKAAFSRALGRPVEVLVARNYMVLAQAQIDGLIDYATYSAMAYAATMLRCDCLLPVAAPRDADGASGLYSVLVVRRDGAGVQGRLAVGPEISLTTRLVPLAASLAAQTAAAEGRLVEATSAAKAQAMFLSGEVDGFFSWVPALETNSDDAEAVTDSISSRLAATEADIPAWQIVWQSPLLRYGPHAVRNDLPAAQVRQLADLLTGISGDVSDLSAYLARKHGSSFASVSAADYKPVEEALGMIGYK